METIFKPNSEFNFSKLSLGQPQPLQGGSYYTKLTLEGNDIYVQFPKCKTKQGLIQTERKMYADLMYETDNHAELSEWLENLETTCQKIIYEKRNMWFNTELDMNDIETAFNSIGKFYKSGKFLLVRSFIPMNSNIKHKSNCVVYDEDENILTFQDIDASREIIPLIKLDGIRFSSKSFQIELNVKQIMVLKEQEEVIINKFLIKRGDNQSNNGTKTMNETIKTTGGDVDIKTNANASQLFVPVQETYDDKSSNDLLEYDISLEENDESQDNDDDEDDQSSYNQKSDDDEYDDNDNDEVSLESLEDIEEIAENTPKETIKNNELPTKLSQPLEMTGLKQTSQNNQTINSGENNYSLSGLNEYAIDLDDDEQDVEVEQEDGLDVVNISYETTDESIKLRNPNEVYYEIYKAAREKAKRAKKMAVEAYLEAKNIKTKYMLDDLDESDDDDEYL